MSILELLRIRNNFQHLEISNVLSDTESWWHLPANAITEDEVSGCSATSADLSHRINLQIQQAIKQACAAEQGQCVLLVEAQIALDSFKPEPGMLLDRISIVREPMERAVSAYTHQQRHYAPNETQSADVSQISSSRLSVDECIQQVEEIECSRHLASQCRYQLQTLCGHQNALCLAGACI